MFIIPHMSRLQYYTGKIILILCSILIGIPVGIFVGILYFLRVSLSYPFTMYRLSNNQWLRKVELEQADMWTRHIHRMEQKQKEN